MFGTLKLARRLLSGRGSYKLGSLVDEFELASGLDKSLPPHRATYDVLVTARLFVLLATTRTLEELRDQLSGGAGAGKTTVIRHLAQMLVAHTRLCE